MENPENYLQAFRKVSRALISSLDAREVIHLIARVTPQTLGVRGSTIRLLGERNQLLILIASHGLSERYLLKGPIDADRSLADSLEGVPVRIEEVATDPRVQYPDEALVERIASMLSVPMLLKERVIGVLRLYSEIPHEFPDDSVEFASAMADMAALALENSRLYSHLRDEYDALMQDLWTSFDPGSG